MKRIFGWVRLHWHQLVQLHDTPHSIAGGTAIGVFFGFTPFFGFKTLLGILAAWGFRCSRVAAAIGVTLHDIVIPLIPVLLREEYKLGFWLINGRQWPHRMDISHFHLTQWLKWHSFVEVIWPTFLGSVIIGLPISALTFYVTLRFVRRFQQRQSDADATALGIDTGDEPKR